MKIELKLKIEIDHVSTSLTTSLALQQKCRLTENGKHLLMKSCWKMTAPKKLGFDTKIMIEKIVDECQMFPQFFISKFERNRKKSIECFFQR